MKTHFLIAVVLLCNAYTTAQEFTQSELPIIVLTTTIEEIPDEPKVLGGMGIIYGGEGVVNQLTDSFTEYNGNIGIETRGNSTQGFDKKTYTLELWDAELNEISVNLLGMGGEEDWVLHAMVIDKTQLRIPMSFYLAQQMGHYAADWRYVEVTLNGQYQGIYILTEQIKRDDDRVDIAKLDLDDLAGDSLTGGYILRMDWTWDVDYEDLFFSEYNSQAGYPMPYQYYYPKASNILPTQKTYIKGFMDEFENAVFSDDYTNSQGFRYNDYIDTKSFVDFLLINEFSKNSDGYKLSSYMHKDRDDNDSRLKAGPIWDFDQTYGLSTVCSSNVTNGWTYLQNQDDCGDLESMPMFWQAMMEDTLFQNATYCRWNELREGPLHQDSLFNWIDSYVFSLTNPLERNFETWDFIGEQIWIEPDNFPDTYEGEIEYLKNWMTERLTWMDDNMPGSCDYNWLSTEDISPLGEYSIYPNPTSNEVFIYPSPESNSMVYVYNSLGQIVLEKRAREFKGKLSLDNFPEGMYFLRINGMNSTTTKKIQLQR